VKWYVGRGLDAEFVCVPCAEALEKGGSVETELVCEKCFQHATLDVCSLERVGGQPEVRVLPTSFSGALDRTPLPRECRRIVDIAPLQQERRSIWLLLTEDGGLHRFEADTGTSQLLCSEILPPHESNPHPYRNKPIRPRLHAYAHGEFAALVNDYGCHGSVIDLRSGKITLALHGGDYWQSTVPFSFAFSSWQGNVVVIHRTDWNRLDVSDASSGRLISDRGPTSYQQGQERPAHYLDYFHGALYLSPGGTRILDDGWVWHPLGEPVVWSMNRWLSENVWEAEDGPSKIDVCGRDSYWDHGNAWLDEDTVAIGGIGDDEDEMIDGARIFDVTSRVTHKGRWRDWESAREINAFAGPTGAFFSNGKWLYSSAKDSLSIWNPKTGVRVGQIENFSPTCHHLGAGELAQLAAGELLRWRTADLP
jgi:hypothetical protein